MHNTCVLISSSDNTFDVFSIVSKSILEHWPIDAMNFYVGLNAKVAGAPFQTIAAPRSGWRAELRFQVSRLPKRFHYIILLLDDFFFQEDVDLFALSNLIEVMEKQHIDYMRLKPLERSAIGNVIRYLGGCSRNALGVDRISENEPYYSSLQAAIWNRSYLIKLLAESGSIWDFEHHVVPGSNHCAISRQFIKYIHLVEKGKWLKYAPVVSGVKHHESFRARGFQQSLLRHSRIFNRIKFFIFGYMIFRMRRAITGFKTR